MLKKLLVPFLILALFMVVGCDKDNPTEPEQKTEFELLAELGDVYFTSYTNAAGAGVNTTMSALYDLLTDTDASNDPYMIDFRSAADYAAGYIKGTVNMTYDNLVAKIDDGTIPKDKPIVNICYSGQGASRATALLNMLGYQAQNLLFAYCGVDTGITKADKWVGQTAADEYTSMETTANTTTTTYDFPVLSTGEETAEAIIKARWTAMLSDDWTASATDVWDNPSNYFIINYWPASEYANPGHIPGAYQFTPKSSLKTTEMLNLLPTDKTIVVYCYTGQTSAQVVTYLRILGYDAQSLLYGVNGFYYHGLDAIGHQYKAPAPDIYDAVLEP
ncbi:rhodanese-like domain-containing protein [candidate division KSB1 bacterium]|nr:rhodanese-like domain-containing protein [candidate division KSB1 bacterium]MBL7093713.1 rhodanese-like domain-containing protein [candidate division KSB1 bacterium]